MPMWTKEQNDAITKNGTNIIVSAGAGSGKTAVLSARVINKLKQGIHINELLILTFTKAAAKEMKERIRKSIKKDPSLANELVLIDSAYITTFDSYALSIVKKYHYLLNLDRDIAISDASILDLVKEQVMDSVFQSFYEAKDEQFLSLIKDFCVKDDVELKNAMKRIAKQLEIKSDLTSYLETYEKEQLNDLIFCQYIDEYNELIMNEKEQFNELFTDFSHYVDQDYYDKAKASLAGMIQAKDMYELKLYTASDLPRLARGSDDTVKAAKERLSKALKMLKEKLLFSSKEEYFTSLEKMKPNVIKIIMILKKYFTLLKVEKEKQSLFDFNDIALLSLQILREHENVCHEIKYSLKEIMIDEYQDTNDIQEEFISCIENQNIYMVGDVKQSIYRFRNANPDIFKHKYDQYSNLENGIKIDLLKNFRSRSEVLLNINQLFNVIMDDLLGGANYLFTHQMVYGNKLYDIHKDNNINNFIDIVTYQPKNFSYKKEEIEAFYIANDIKKKIENNVQVFDKELEKLRNITYADCVILMDRGKDFELYKQIFTYLNIPLEIEKDEILSDSLDFQLIKNLFGLYVSIIDDNSSLLKFSFTSIARSFLYEYSDERIFIAIKENKISQSRVYQEMKEIVDETFGFDIYTILNQILNKTNYIAQSIKIGDVKDHMLIINTIKELALQNSQKGKLVQAFYDYLNTIIESDFQLKYTKRENENDCVKIMTIHKSKGLEYPLCYYSGLYKKFNAADIKEQFMFDQKYGFVTPFIEKGIIQNFLFDLVKTNFTSAEVSEKIRLFYVALTRAREKMIVILPNDVQEYEQNRGLLTYYHRIQYRSFADIIYSVFSLFQDRLKSINNLTLSRDYLIHSVQSIELENNQEKVEVKELVLQKQIVEHKRFSKENRTLYSKEERENIKYGLLFHEYLENLDFLSPNFDFIQDDFIKEKIEHFYFALKQFSLIRPKFYQEYEFSYQYQELEFYGIIDLLIVDVDQIYIIDYKLSDLGNKAYIDQLNGYKAFIEAKEDIPVKCFLYSILKQEFKQI